ncbi:MAG: hypothetical protein WD556_11400 [Actinomycetota bacterium]
MDGDPRSRDHRPKSGGGGAGTGAAGTGQEFVLSREVRALGRFNGWSHDYWKTIGWLEFWIAHAEAAEAAQELSKDRHQAHAERALEAHERSIAYSTGLATPYMNPN